MVCHQLQSHQSVSSAAERLNRILDGNGNASARIPVGTDGGIHIWIWCRERRFTPLAARTVGKSSRYTETLIENSAPMPAISNTGLAVSVMDKRPFHNEKTFQVTVHQAKRMLAAGLITEKEYCDFVQEMIRKYQPFSSDLYAC